MLMKIRKRYEVSVKEELNGLISRFRAPTKRKQELRVESFVGQAEILSHLHKQWIHESIPTDCAKKAFKAKSRRSISPGARVTDVFPHFEP